MRVVKFSAAARSCGWCGSEFPWPAGSVLDVGCGYGGTLVAFAEQAADVVGIEIDEERARIGKKRLTDLGIKAGYRRDDICKAGVERRLGTFDVIVAQDVLEHVLDPGRTIRTLSSLLRPGGVIYAQMGNKYSPDQLLADHHYGRAGITLLAREQAIDYFRLATGIDARHYGVGYWRTERYYDGCSPASGSRSNTSIAFANSNYVDLLFHVHGAGPPTGRERNLPGPSPRASAANATPHDGRQPLFRSSQGPDSAVRVQPGVGGEDMRSPGETDLRPRLALCGYEAEELPIDDCRLTIGRPDWLAPFFQSAICNRQFPDPDWVGTDVVKK